MEYLQKIIKNKKLQTFLPILLVIILAFTLRFIYLDKIPNAIGGDELIYAITAKSIILSGTDLTGTFNPLSLLLFNYPPNQMQAEIPYFLLLPTINLAISPLLSARIDFALMSTFTVLVIYLIAKKLTNEKVGIIAAFIAAINPWFIYIGRTNYEMVPATLFFLCGLCAILTLKGWKILISLLFLYLAFYSYIATKVIFLPFVFIAVLDSYLVIHNKKYSKQYLIVLIMSLFLVIFFTFSIKNNSNSRIGELISINDPSIVKQVDYLRQNSIHSPISNLIESKPVVFSNILMTKFFKSFSFDYLFTSGDEFFSLNNHGLFYYLDLIFMVLGFGFIFARQRKAAIFLLGMIIISTFPHIIHGASISNFTPHISLIFPFIIIFIAYGIWEIIYLFKSYKYKLLSAALIVFLYLISLGNFLNIYFYQFPLEGHFDFSERILSKYISVNDSKEKIIVYSPRTYDIFTKYLFYSNSLKKSSIKEVRSNMKNGIYKLGNVYFSPCNNTLSFTKSSGIIIYDSICGDHPGTSTSLLIPRLSDGGPSYKIYNDKACGNLVLKGYPSNLSINDFAIEGMNKQKFCETFITSL